jgi:hypothetical protein
MNEQIRLGRFLQAALAAVLPCGPQVLEAQGKSARAYSTTNRFWADFGAGGGTYEQRCATAFSANYQRNGHLFILLSGSNSEILFERSLVDTALFYGRMRIEVRVAWCRNRFAHLHHRVIPLRFTLKHNLS